MPPSILFDFQPKCSPEDLCAIVLALPDWRLQLSFLPDSDAGSRRHVLASVGKARQSEQLLLQILMADAIDRMM